MCAPIKKIKHRIIKWSSNCTSEHIPKGTERRGSGRYCPNHVHSSITHVAEAETNHVLIVWRMEKEPNVVYIQWNITQPEKGRTFWHMLQPGWTLKTASLIASHKGQILYWLYSRKVLVKFICTKGRMVFGSGWGLGNKESLFNGYGVSSGEDEVLEMDGGNAWTALWVYLLFWIIYLKNE